jgi:hypothetical protein
MADDSSAINLIYPMIISIHQPQYLPWLGYFDKILESDIFVFLDNVQYKKNEFQNRNKIKTAKGWQWLTVPVLYHFSQKIFEVGINQEINWQKDHLKTLIVNYNRAPFFGKYSAYFEKLYSKTWGRLIDINIEVVKHLAGLLGAKTKFFIASQIPNLREEPTERLIDICKYFSVNTYLAGKGGAEYMDIEKFKKENINLIFQNFQHPVYPQLYGDFQPCMSVIDLLFNCGPGSRDIIKNYKLQIADCKNNV